MALKLSLIFILIISMNNYCSYLLPQNTNEACELLEAQSEVQNPDSGMTKNRY